MSDPLYTIGHSTRELNEFLELLGEHDIGLLVDVRRFPGSRRYPHFGSESLRASLGEAGIEYRHAPELGGRRDAARDSPNLYWRNAGFRAYADYMSTPAFREAFAVLEADVARRRTAIMCAEAVPWRCHRNLVSDAAVAGGMGVVHILGAGQAQEHVLNAAAVRAQDGSLAYPAPGASQVDLGL